MTAAYSLRFGDIDMSPNAQIDDVEYRVYGLRRGYPAPVSVAVNSMMQDGGLEHVTRHENRDQSIIIGLRASDTEVLARAESALFVEAQKVRNELAWTPADGYGAETVFDVLWASLEFADADDWDLEELLRCERVYVLTVRALPFGRAATETIVSALTSSASPSTTTISDGSSATNWTGTSTVTSSGGELKQTCTTSRSTISGAQATYRASGTYTYTPAAPLNFSTENYLAVPFDYLTPGVIVNTMSMRAFADGIELPLVNVRPISADQQQATFVCSDPSVSVLAITISSQHTTWEEYNIPSVTYAIDNIVKSNQAPSVSTTGRESVRTVTVGGSARTQASLQISHATSALGRVAVYTAPALDASGYSPPLRPYRSSSGGDTADTATLSGTRTDAGIGSPQFQVPAARLPKGGYLLFLRCRSKSGTITPTFTWTAETQISSTTMGTQTGSTAPVSLTAGATGWQLVPLGGMVLPPTDVSESSSATVKLNVSSSSAGYEWDEALLFFMGDDAALTIVDAGTGSVSIGTAHNSLWVQSPSLANPAPRVLLGVDGALESAFHAGEKAQAWGVHQFPPGDVNIFVSTPNASNPEVSGKFFRRAHTHITAEEE